MMTGRLSIDRIKFEGMRIIPETQARHIRLTKQSAREDQYDESF